MDVVSDTIRFRWQDAVDLGLLALVLYAALLWAQKARAVRIAFVIVFLHVAGVTASCIGLTMTAWMLHGASLVALVMLFVLFQPEVRHSVISLISGFSRGAVSHSPLAGTHEAISDAAFALAERGRGALIVLARSGPFSEGVAHGGTPLSAKVSLELLEAVFSKDSRLHDGAAVVEGDRITRAGVLLPVTSRTDVPTQFGLRHRAAMGLAECCDAVAIVVSEERGEVRLVYKRHVSAVESSVALFHQLQELQRRPGPLFTPRMRRPTLANLGLALAAMLLAGLVWMVGLLEASGG